jgi:hypothetical protein
MLKTFAVALLAIAMCRMDPGERAQAHDSGLPCVAAGGCDMCLWYRI